MNQGESIPHAVGAFVSRARSEHGLTLDQIASVARSYGAGWSASSVRNIERGQASLTLPTMLLLALALGHLTGRPLKLSDLLGDAELLALGTDSRYPVRRAWLDAALGGRPVTFDEDDTAGADDVDRGDFDEHFEDEVLRELRKMRGREMTHAHRQGQLEQLTEQAHMPPEPKRRFTTSGAAGSLAEERAAKKLGTTGARLRQLAQDLWGRPLEDESSRRAGPGSTPQARGRITRVLVDELRESMKDAR